jgi:hypothetical protein
MLCFQSKIGGVTPEQTAAWNQWLAERPAHVRAVAERWPATRLYWLDPPGQVVAIHSYDEEMDGRVTLKVDVTMENNVDADGTPRVFFDRRVFGILPSDLHELDDRRLI